MTTNQIRLKYDEFFGTGLWEKDYKPHISVFAEQCVRQASENDGFILFSDDEPMINTPLLIKRQSGKVSFGFYLGNNEFRISYGLHADPFIAVSSTTTKEYKYLNP